MSPLVNLSRRVGGAPCRRVGGAPLLVILAFASSLSAEPWSQWGANGRHQGNSAAVGHRLQRIEAEMLLDPFVNFKKGAGGGSLLTHYPVPLVDRDEIVVVTRTGEYTSFTTPESQIWNVTSLRRMSGGPLQTRWSYPTDWKPVPMNTPGGPFWEPVYHVAMSRDAIWAPGAGGTIDKLSRTDGTRIMRVNPFGVTEDPTTYVTGPPTVADNGDVYYNAIRLVVSGPFINDPVNSWLVRVTPEGQSSVATFASLTPNAPASADLCTTNFSTAQLPWPPSRDAMAPGAPCGAQRPGINISPAVAPDGTVYTVSRAHLNERWGFLVAANADLTPKWSSTLRNRFLDGCNVLLPPNGAPGGCRIDAMTGVDPAENQPGSGRVTDLSTSSPVVAPDGNIIYGAQSRYNYLQGHLMMFAPNGGFLRSYPFGWDITPAIYEHDGTYSVILKENRYAVSSYCSNPQFCPSNRTAVTPNDPEQYLITQLDPQFRVEWQYRNTETRTCRRLADGEIQCVTNRPNNFEFCVNAVAVDRNGVVFANAEDGYLYAIGQDGKLIDRIFLQEAHGAAYTPLAIGHDGRIYTQNDARLFIVSQNPRPRAVRATP
ncbi:MAG TPA: hypothetical protein VMS98_19640 [Thermoanaerobaculia bacterium]|nr:hypothetical protein [Thermoanaerobaculia bacterium]